MGISLRQLAHARKILERHRHAQRALDIVGAHQFEHRVELVRELGEIEVTMRINQHNRTYTS